MSVPNERHIKRLEIAKQLTQQNLTFFEFNHRTSYGLIGHIYYGNLFAVLVFPNCFYVKDFNFSLNDITLALIADIQKEFEDNIRDEKNTVIVDKDGIGSRNYVQEIKVKNPNFPF